MVKNDVFAALGNNPVIPVLVVENVDHAVPMAKALVAGGLTALEVTLRTASALQVVKRIANDVPEVIIGVGTVVRAEQFEQVKKVGAQFVVSPGCTETLAKAAQDADMPFLPGAVTASEIIAAMELGISDLKFFPAGTSGGAAALKSFSSVFPDVRFCPTGGVKAVNMADYLSLPNVAAVGGSWLVNSELLNSGNWSEITRLASSAKAQAEGILATPPTHR
ncbi:MAG: keto-deoxy-phosphogluconate aldolase [Proteobacteria bacterium]|nr:MAG: keto-deoxy-phosphogluconate aldolase [Pseudomonadota bacterium]